MAAPLPRELVVQFRTALAGSLAAAHDSRQGSVHDLAKRLSIAFVPLASAPQMQQLVASAGREAAAEIADLQNFFYVEKAPDSALESIALELAQAPEVAAAYVKPPAEPAMVPRDAVGRGLPQRPPGPPAGVLSPDYRAKQGYLNDAGDGGVGAITAWRTPGGRGDGVTIIDVEFDWQFTHECLAATTLGLIGGTPYAPYRDHGTAVLGELCAADIGIGVVGIAPAARAGGVSAIDVNDRFHPAKATEAAANALKPGDVLLIELHRPGPRFGYSSPSGQDGYIAVEWWPDELAAIRYAIRRGIIVVEAAGNGAEDLGDALYDQRPPEFPPTWVNPYRRRSPVHDSGAIIVGAGAPPPGTNGRDHGPARSRLGFSNYGPCVDAQGWGAEVVTTGYGDLQHGPDENRWYSDTFSGTSSASPIVAAVAACIQGARKAAGKTPLTPSVMRNLLQRTGSPQQDAPRRPARERIGPLPDLAQLLPAALALP